MRARRAFAAAWVGVSFAALQESGAKAQTELAHAATATTFEGRVLAIEGKDVIVDVARAAGASEGDVLEMYRPLMVRHPVTRRAIVDRYRIGELTLTQVRDRIALGRASGSLLRPPAVGDIIVRAEAVPAGEPPSSPSSRTADLGGAPRPPSTAATAATAARVPAASSSSVQQDASAGELNTLFDSLHGATLVNRVGAYERYAASHPASPYSRTLLEEAAALRELIAARSSRAGTGPTNRAGSTEPGAPVALHFIAPDTTVERTPLAIGIELGGAVAGGVLSLRTAGEVAYRTLPMHPSGDGYFAVVIPAERVLVREIQYFIEAVLLSGDAVPVAGAPEAPLKTRVEQIPQAAPPLSHDSSISVVSEYADYNRLHGNDRVFHTEGTFAIRFREVGVRALRTGFGVYRGVGGSIEALDHLGLPPRNVGFTYGYIEGEFGIKPTLSLITRAIIGLGDDGTTGGAQLHLRIGSDRSTNLSFGGEVLGGIGVRGISELQLQPLGRFPVLVRSEVTNQPAGTSPSRPLLTDQAGRTDIGVRAIVQVGYRPVDSLVLALRGSYQGRTIDHSGPGFGAAVEYRW